MSKKHNSPSLLILLIEAIFITVSSDTTFRLINKCTYTVWPGILSNVGLPQLSTTGFPLPSGTVVSLPVPSSWSGRIWARTLCSTTSSATAFSCLTGDCGSPTVECSGNGAVPPATLAEFTLGGYNGLDFYDVSLVDGYNLPMVILPRGGGNCSVTGCYVDLNGQCPVALRLTATVTVGGVRQSVACRSACEAFGEPKYCCSGAYSTPGACKPSGYSEYFKSACPSAYSYAYDDATSTFTCAGADYDIIFCPTPAKIKKSSAGEDTTAMSPAEAPALFSIATVTPSPMFTTPVLLLLTSIWTSCDNIFFGLN